MTRLQHTRLLCELVCEHYNIKRKQLLHGRKQKTIVAARHTLAWLLRLYGLSYPDIGAEMAGRDHTTALNSVQKASASGVLVDDALTIQAHYECELVIHNLQLSATSDSNA